MADCQLPYSLFQGFGDARRLSMRPQGTLTLPIPAFDPHGRIDAGASGNRIGRVSGRCLTGWPVTSGLYGL